MKAPGVAVRGHRVIVKWKAAKSNGAPIRRYLINISRGENKSVRATVRRAVFKRLKPGKYRIRIAAKNSIGSSTYSKRVEFRIR